VARRSRQAAAHPELRLHAARDFLYALIFATLPGLAFRGAWTLALGLVLLAEIVITLRDFMVEDRVRAGFGGVLPGERATHAIMGILYGAMLAFLLPTLATWWGSPTALVVEPAPVPEGLRLALWAMAAGVFLSGLRDSRCRTASLPAPGRGPERHPEPAVTAGRGSRSC
jgi:hypothetical protein